ncbi:acyltransferase family protein, partial [Listeria valentina]|uniref:acyltransferase family protein n=1 Tax=Listeria valentina TaxID=2705293 RepID=UPI001430AE8A
SYIHSIIYSFHMPLFFWISGFFAIKICSIAKTSYLSFIKSKAVRLIIPYISVSLIGIPIKLLFNHFAERPSDGLLDLLCKMLVYPTSNAVISLWFLYTLFIIYIFILIIKNFPLYLVLPLLLFLNLFSAHFSELFNISGVCEYSIYFYVGMLCRTYYTTLVKCFNKLSILILSSFIIILAGFFSLNNIFVQLIVAFVGIIMCVTYAYQIPEKIGILFLVLGNYSMSIYILSWFPQVATKTLLLSILEFPYFIVVLGILISGFIPIFIEKFIFRKNSWLSVLFLGKK